MKKLVVLSYLIISIFSSQQAAGIVITWTYTLSFDGGTDSGGMDGSTWTYVATLGDTYATFGSYVGVSSESIQLTISGASDNDYNGTFAISERDTTNFLFVPYVIGGNSLIMRDTNTNSGDFSFGSSDGLSVFNLGLNDPTPVLSSAPSVGSTVSASDFVGLTFSNGHNLGLTSANTANAAVSPSEFTISSVSVPEPSAFVFILGLATLGVVGVGRRNRRQRS